MIKIFCHGEFYYKTENTKGRKPFVQEIKAPNLEFFKQTAVRYTGTDDEGKLKFKETEFVNVRGIIKKRLLPMLLAPRFSDFVRVRTVTIDEIESATGELLELPVTLQSRNQLIHLCQTKKIPVDATSYMDIDELRTDILEYQTDPEVFLRNMQHKSKKRLEEKEFMELNGLTVPTPTPAVKPKSKSVPEIASKPVGTRSAEEPIGIADL